MSSNRVAAVRRYTVLVIFVALLALIVVDRAGVLPALRGLTNRLYDWMVLLGAFALLLGVINVAWVHVRRIHVGGPGWTHSLALVATLLVVFVAGVMDEAGTAGPLAEWIFDSVIAPGQAALFSLLAFALGAAAYRYLRPGRPGGIWLLTGALFMLIVQAPVSHVLLPQTVTSFSVWLVDWPMMAALRGVLSNVQ